MCRITYTEGADEDLSVVAAYSELHYPFETALAFRRRLNQSIAQLISFPKLATMRRRPVRLY
jgi:plasmid stabilization system protein ParE